MSSRKGSRKASSIPTTPAAPLSVCYCDGSREVGTLELQCGICQKWFHGKCLKDLTNFYGLSFMVCYVFNCKECSPTKTETWVAKQANFIHMCVTVLANLTADELRDKGELDKKQSAHTFFSLEKVIIPYFNKNWEHLTSMPRRVKTTWHATLQKTLSKEADLFKVDPSDDNSFGLAEINLGEIGPNNDAVKQIGKKSTSSNNLQSTLVQAAPVEKVKVVEESEGPKTRGASKRRNADTGGTIGKKTKQTSDYSSSKVAGQENSIDFPFNKEGYRYYLVEKDPNVPNRDQLEQEESAQARPIPPYIYRIATSSKVTLSPNDRAYQLKVSDDLLSVTGQEGYCVARASHSVSRGTWYYEVKFVSQPTDTHVRIGWSQALAPVQACVGYNRFSYSWRSHMGTKFHDAIGKKYWKGGYKEGDVLGCLVHLPDDASRTWSEKLPASKKDMVLINFKHNYFYEEKDDASAEEKKLKALPGSRIEFFHNGKSCGVAFEDIHGGFYHPAVSIFGGATLKCNFGPKFAYPVKGALPMSDRPAQLDVEQTVSDVLYLADNEKLFNRPFATPAIPPPAPLSEQQPKQEPMEQ